MLHTPHTQRFFSMVAYHIPCFWSPVPSFFYLPCCFLRRSIWRRVRSLHLRLWNLTCITQRSCHILYMPAEMSNHFSIGGKPQSGIQLQWTYPSLSASENCFWRICSTCPQATTKKESMIVRWNTKLDHQGKGRQSVKQMFPETRRRFSLQDGVESRPNDKGTPVYIRISFASRTWNPVCEWRYTEVGIDSMKQAFWNDPDLAITSLSNSCSSLLPTTGIVVCFPGWKFPDSLDQLPGLSQTLFSPLCRHQPSCRRVLSGWQIKRQSSPEPKWKWKKFVPSPLKPLTLTQPWGL